MEEREIISRKIIDDLLWEEGNHYILSKETIQYIEDEISHGCINSVKEPENLFQKSHHLYSYPTRIKKQTFSIKIPRGEKNIIGDIYEWKKRMSSGTATNYVKMKIDLKKVRGLFPRSLDIYPDGSVEVEFNFDYLI